jgi:5-methylcytosine-specific restriction enzyme B
MTFLEGVDDIQATIVHNTGSIIRFKTSQAQNLPSDWRDCSILLPDGTSLHGRFNPNRANPNISGEEVVAWIKGLLRPRETRSIRLVQDPESEGVLKAILDDEILPLDDSSQEHAFYGVESIVADGSFLSKETLERILYRLFEKKNLILQGPPGTGKTWLAKRLGMALIGHKPQEPQLRVIQFHPNLSYEDFVRGWRPDVGGLLKLHEGVFMQMVTAALAAPEECYVLVIEEINRGNPAQIFGELLTLLESGRRTPRDSVQLCYPDGDGIQSPVYVPENLFVIGTMNIADRSLAIVDLAFRRRFAFFNLEPALGEAWRNWVVNKFQVELGIAIAIEARINQLNQTISADRRLGRAFQIGHSYVTPTQSMEGRDVRDWFAEVVDTELKPLLEEYWFDAPEEVEGAITQLLVGW